MHMCSPSPPCLSASNEVSLPSCSLMAFWTENPAPQCLSSPENKSRCNVVLKRIFSCACLTAEACNAKLLRLSDYGKNSPGAAQPSFFVLESSTRPCWKWTHRKFDACTAAPETAHCCSENTLRMMPAHTLWKKLWVDGDHHKQLGRLHCMLSYSKRSAHEVPENFGFWMILTYLVPEPVWKITVSPFECMATIYPKFKHMKLSFFVAHAGCLPERVTTRLTDLRSLTVRFTEKSPVRLTDLFLFKDSTVRKYVFCNEWTWMNRICLTMFGFSNVYYQCNFLTLHQTICSLEWFSEHQKFETAIRKIGWILQLQTHWEMKRMQGNNDIVRAISRTISLLPVPRWSWTRCIYLYNDTSFVFASPDLCLKWAAPGACKAHLLRTKILCFRKCIWFWCNTFCYGPLDG